MIIFLSGNQPIIIYFSDITYCHICNIICEWSQIGPYDILHTVFIGFFAHVYCKTVYFILCILKYSILYTVYTEIQYLIFYRDLYFIFALLLCLSLIILKTVINFIFIINFYNCLTKSK